MKPLLETLRAGAGYLEKHGVEEARLNMEHLLAHVLGCRRLDLYLRFNEELGERDLEALRPLVKRRAEGVPLQHLLGTVEFHGSELVCDHRALIPRPETEHLVELLARRFTGTQPRRVLDMATGSGCIGLSLARNWPDASVTLADVSEDALDLARLNASRLNLGEVQILRSDLFEKIQGAFDLIVANLPYIPTAEIHSLSREVRRDPVLALDGGEDGLDLVKRFVADCVPHLEPGGWIALELHHDQGPSVVGLCTAAGFAEVENPEDLAGIARFVLARCPSSKE